MKQEQGIPPDPGEDSPSTLPFRAPTESVATTDEFEMDIPPSPFGQTLDFRFFSKLRVREAVPTASEVQLTLPTGAILLVAVRPLQGFAARSLPS